MIPAAYAQAAGASAGDPLMSFLPIAAMFVLLYFLMIRPQMKRQKEQKQMIEALQKGDEVITGSGILGRITKVTDAYVTVEVAEGDKGPIEMRFQKAAVQLVLPKGTIKSL